MNNHSVIDISILVCAFNMERELPRTLFTLSKQYQLNIENLNLEIIVLDNGSTTPICENELQSVCPEVQVVRPKVIKVSPSSAINSAMKSLRGNIVGLWIDGARLASPGIINLAYKAWCANSSKAIGTLGFHLGPDVQMRSVFQGYNNTYEDALLESVSWQENGYRLFEISVLADSSRQGWFGCINETNALFMDRHLWEEIGGLDERFEAPGGGFVNLDLWTRIVAASNGHPWMILGEGTFHQVHGGVATNGTANARKKMHEEYISIHGMSFSTPKYESRYVGSLDYHSFTKGIYSQLDNQRKVHSIRCRNFKVDLPTVPLANIQRGTLNTTYKGLKFAKDPFDIVLYLRVLERLRPATIIEIGTLEGGSAVWLKDQCKALGLDSTQLLTIDIISPSLEVPGVFTYQGDAAKPDETFPNDVISSVPHPWLVIEDSAHTYDTTIKVLEYFDWYLQPGDMLVVEDGVLADLESDNYRTFKDGPNRAVAEFLDRTGNRYIIDESLCDFYGHNVTYAPNAWLRRV